MIHHLKHNLASWIRRKISCVKTDHLLSPTIIFLFIFLCSIFLIGCDAPSKEAPLQNTDTYEVEISSDQSELQIDGESSAVLTAKVKKNDNYITSVLPDGWSLFVSHDNTEIKENWDA
ncbi:MAG: hypothetical protein ABIH69_07585 [bacterium]